MFKDGAGESCDWHTQLQTGEPAEPLRIWLAAVMGPWSRSVLIQTGVVAKTSFTLLSINSPEVPYHFIPWSDCGTLITTHFYVHSMIKSDD